MKATTPKPGLQLLRRVPEGACAECAVVHEPEQPHNAESLFYQYKFLEDHGTWPNWGNALAHCSPEVRKQWETELLAHGVAPIELIPR